MHKMMRAARPVYSTVTRESTIRRRRPTYSAWSCLDGWRLNAAELDDSQGLIAVRRRVSQSVFVESTLSLVEGQNENAMKSLVPQVLKNAAH